MSKPNFRIIEQESGAVDYSKYEEFEHKYRTELDKNTTTLYREVGVSSELGLKYIKRIKKEKGYRRLGAGNKTILVPLDYERKHNKRKELDLEEIYPSFKEDYLKEPLITSSGLKKKYKLDSLGYMDLIHLVWDRTGYKRCNGNGKWLVEVNTGKKRRIGACG